MSRFSWTDLPDALVCLVAANLDKADWRHMRQACKAWNAAIDVTRADIRVQAGRPDELSMLASILKRRTWKLHEAHIDVMPYDALPLHLLFPLHAHRLQALRLYDDCSTDGSQHVMDLSFLAGCPDLHTLELDCLARPVRLHLAHPLANLKNLSITECTFDIDVHMMPGLEDFRCMESRVNDLLAHPIHAPNLHTFVFDGHAMDIEGLPTITDHSIRRLGLWADRLGLLPRSVAPGVTHLFVYADLMDFVPSEWRRVFEPFTALELVVVYLLDEYPEVDMSDLCFAEMVAGMPPSARLAVQARNLTPNNFEPVIPPVFNM